jgi:hypothetical protein
MLHESGHALRPVLAFSVGLLAASAVLVLGSMITPFQGLFAMAESCARN